MTGWFVTAGVPVAPEKSVTVAVGTGLPARNEACSVQLVGAALPFCTDLISVSVLPHVTVLVMVAVLCATDSGTVKPAPSGVFVAVPFTFVTAAALVHRPPSMSVTVSVSAAVLPTWYPVRVTPHPWSVAPAAPGPVMWSCDDRPPGWAPLAYATPLTIQFLVTVMSAGGCGARL